ncbi:MAG TPA: hypothetical protein VE093_19505 [Polyangiaceae bacterium]|nr:hypothetical protein [Polyangiaceae bacterium]
METIAAAPHRDHRPAQAAGRSSWVRAAIAALVPLAAGLELAACSPLKESAPEPTPVIEVRPEAPTQSLVFVTLDGVRRREIFLGVDPMLAARSKLPRAEVKSARDLLPNMYRLFFDEGTVLGDPRKEGGVAASGPHFVSLPSYLEMMMGVSSGCWNNDCIPTMRVTIAEELAASNPLAPSAVFASWERIARAAAADKATGSLTISAGREKGSGIAPWPGHGAYRPDRVTGPLALNYLRDNRPRFLWISLGDTDELAHHNDYRGYLAALRSADELLGSIAAELDRMGERGARTALIVTTDHDRSANFTDHGDAGSGSVWLLARGPSIAPAGSIGTSTQRYLRDIAPTLRALFDLPARPCEGCGRPIDELLPREGVEPPTFAAESSSVRTALAPSSEGEPSEGL